MNKLLAAVSAFLLLAGPVMAQDITNSPGSAASGSNSSANSGSVSGSISQGGSSGATATNGAANAGNAQSVTFNTSSPERLKTVPQVYAPALSTTLTETCMGSTSGGISVMGFGGTLGSTWNDTQCVRRLNAREMAQTLGDREAARALLCQDKDVAAAYLAVSQSCTQAWSPPAAAALPAPIPPPAPEPYAAPVTAPQAVPPVPGVMAPIPNPSTYPGERG
jgi:hypothetical protein